MARNRKRAKDRRSRRPPDAGVATAQAGLDEHTPGPIEHASPDVELAEAQLALGRPELTGEQTPEEIEALVEAEEAEDELGGYTSPIPGLIPGQTHVVGAPDELEEVPESELEAEAGGGRGGRRRRPEGEDLGGDDDGASSELAPAAASVPAAKPWIGKRITNFLRASWRELQRVQWPDRRQVVQATGVVIGFVIAMGLFLGGADWVSQHLVTQILK